MTGNRWITRTALADIAPPGEASGLLLASPLGETVVSLDPEALSAALRVSSASLELAGLTRRDRVVVALNNDAGLAGSLVAQAASRVAGASVATGPRGRMRLLRLIEAVRPTALICTPTGALDLLARLHMEFLVDPMELGLEKILVVGDIVADKPLCHLGAEFDVEVIEMLADPTFGVLLAARRTGETEFTLGDPDTAFLAEVDRDEDATGSDAAYRELIVRPTWTSDLAEVNLRSGLVVGPGPSVKGVPSLAHTVGDHVLIRGLWLSVPRLGAALKRIDGVEFWSLRIERPGTLDKITLEVCFNRPELTGNQMWLSRISQLLVAMTPVRVEVDTVELTEVGPPPIVNDRRGHHLGQVRADLTA